MKKLYFKCQPILPMTFSDSVSYYETLCQLTKKLNETIEQSNKNTAKIENIFDTQGLFVPIASTENVGGIYGSVLPSIDWEKYALSPIFVDESGNASALYQIMNTATNTKIGGIKVNSEPSDGIEGIVYLDNNNFARCKTTLPNASTGRSGVIRLGEEPEEGIETPVYTGDHGVAYVKYSIPIANSDNVGGIKSQEYNRTGAICNVHVDENGLATVKVPSFTIDDITSIPVATDIRVGGIKSQEHLEASGTEYPVHVALTGYASVKIPTSGYVLPQASATTLGGIKAAAKTSSETVEVKIDSSTGVLYVPGYTVPQANATTLGGIKASAKTSSETVEVKIDTSTGKLYVPGGGESYTLPAATTSELGGVKVTATEASKTKLPVSIDSNNIIHAELGAPTTSEFGGFKLVTGYSEVGNTHYVNVNGQGNAYVKVPSGGGGGSTVYRHDIEVTHYSDVTMFGYKYIKLNYVLYNNTATQITGSSSAMLDAIFCGGYANTERTSTYSSASTAFYNRIYNSTSTQYLSSSSGVWAVNTGDLLVRDTVSVL